MVHAAISTISILREVKLRCRAGGPYVIKVIQKIFGTTKKITLSNVLFGDVWFCGGQSNMQFTLRQVCFRVGFGDVFRPRFALSVENW